MILGRKPTRPMLADLETRAIRSLDVAEEITLVLLQMSGPHLRLFLKPFNPKSFRLARQVHRLTRRTRTHH